MTRIKALFTLVTLPLYLPVAIVKTIIAEQKRAAAVEAGLYTKRDAVYDAWDAYDAYDAAADAAYAAYKAAHADADAAWVAWDAKQEETQEENTND